MKAEKDRKVSSILGDVKSKKSDAQRYLYEAIARLTLIALITTFVLVTLAFFSGEFDVRGKIVALDYR